jgi:hypothetical protein
MNRRKNLLSLLLGLAVSLSLASVVLAQTGGGYDLTWWTVDGGGDTAHGGGYTLAGTAGQADASLSLSGGGYTLTGGFWTAGSADANQYIYLPLVLKY